MWGRQEGTVALPWCSGARVPKGEAMGPEDDGGGSELYRSRSLWLDRLADEEPITPRAPLVGPLEVDVAIVGAGYTGLWTAYYLRRADPGLRIAMVERHVAGFGASGRNGGWCSGFMPTAHEAMAKQAGREATVALQRELYRTVDEVGRIARDEGVDCHWVKGGTVQMASSAMQRERVQAAIADARRWGIGPDDLDWLDAAEARGRIRADGLLGAAWSPHCAAIDPARLAPAAGAAVLADDRDRAAAARDLGGDRLGRPRDRPRRRQPVRVRAADPRRPRRLRRARRPVPLRLDRAPGVRPQRRRAPAPARQPVEAPAPARRGAGHAPLGRAAGAAARLDAVGRARPGQRARLGRRLRRRRRGGGQP